MPSPSPVYMEMAKETALGILRLAVEYADEGSPLRGLHIPAHRFASMAADKWPYLEAHVGDDDGKGLSRQSPSFEVTGDIHFDGLVAETRSNAGNLDMACSQLVQAICDTLLQDQDFLALSSHWPGLRRIREDAAVTAKSGGELDAVIFRITITLAYREGYTPYVPPPAPTTINLDADLGPNPTDDDPAARWFVGGAFTTEST